MQISALSRSGNNLLDSFELLQQQDNLTLAITKLEECVDELKRKLGQLEKINSNMFHKQHWLALGPKLKERRRELASTQKELQSAQAELCEVQNQAAALCKVYNR